MMLLKNRLGRQQKNPKLFHLLKEQNNLQNKSRIKREDLIEMLELKDHIFLVDKNRE